MTNAVDANTYPALPLPDGVILPGMVVTITAESEEARAAATAAADNGGQLLLVPKVGDRFATVGAIAQLESTGTLPGGAQALVVRATGRARLGAGVVGSGPGLWVTAEPVVEGPASEEAKTLGAELRATLRALFEQLGDRQVRGILRGVDADDPGGLADLVGWWPELTTERRIELLEAVEVTDRVRLVLGWAREALAELELVEKISTDVRDGIDEQQREHLLRRQMDAIRKELGEDDDGDAAADYAARIDALEAGGVADEVVRALRKELGRFERMPEQNMERGWIESWLDTVLGLPVDRAHRGSARRDRGPRDPRRRPHGPRRGQGADRRAPRRAQAAGRAGRGRGGHRPPPARRHHRPGRASRGRQDLPRRVRGPRPRAALRAGRPGWRAGRGRDPGPPAHLRRRPARPAGQGHHRGGDHEPRRAPRRGRQAGQ